MNIIDEMGTIPKEEKGGVSIEHPTKKESLMGKLLTETGNPPQVGDVVEGNGRGCVAQAGCVCGCDGGDEW